MRNKEQLRAINIAIVLHHVCPSRTVVSTCNFQHLWQTSVFKNIYIATHNSSELGVLSNKNHFMFEGHHSMRNRVKESQH